MTCIRHCRFVLSRLPSPVLARSLERETRRTITIIHKHNHHAPITRLIGHRHPPTHAGLDSLLPLPAASYACHIHPSIHPSLAQTNTLPTNPSNPAHPTRPPSPWQLIQACLTMGPTSPSLCRPSNRNTRPRPLARSPATIVALISTWPSSVPNRAVKSLRWSFPPRPYKLLC